MLALALTGAIAAVSAVTAGYQSMSPTGQWYGKTLTNLPASRQIALTYDDGPNDPHTLHLLEVLARHNVHATFFLIGRYVQQRPDIVRQIVQAGHAVGNHTFTHPLLTLKGESEIKRELVQCQTAIEDATGQPCSLFRPPFGGRRPAVLRIARELDLATIMWNITGYDWNSPPAATIERTVSKHILGGDVILLHDGGHKSFGADRSQTVISTDHLIANYKSQGFEFVTIPQTTPGSS